MFIISSMGHNIRLSHPGPVSQGYSRVNCLNDGLRILAKIIARDLVSKRQDNTKKKKDRELSDPQISESCQ